MVTIWDCFAMQGAKRLLADLLPKVTVWGIKHDVDQQHVVQIFILYTVQII